MDALVSGSISPSPLLAGVKLLWKDLVLSPDFLGLAFSSLDRAPSVVVGVAAPVRFGDDFVVDVVAVRGVCGLVVGFGLSGSPNSFSTSPEFWSPVGALGLLLAVAPSSLGKPSNRPSSSSSIDFPFDMTTAIGENFVAIDQDIKEPFNAECDHPYRSKRVHSRGSYCCFPRLGVTLASLRKQLVQGLSTIATLKRASDNNFYY